MKNNIHFIFDFDGTLVDSFHAAIEKFNVLSDEFNFRKIKDSEIDELKNLTSKEILNYLKIPIYKMPSVILKARTLIQSDIKKLQPFLNLKETMKKLYEMNINLGILTSNSSDNVSEWLQENDMRHFFNFIHSESNFFGKKGRLAKIIKTYKMDKSRTFYIGDETRDIEAAKSCNINSIAVTWGYHSEKILLQHQPHFIARKPEDIIEIYKHTAKFY